VRRGYFRDNFVHMFVREPAPRPPLINRGYYTRHAILRSLLLDFFESGAEHCERSPRRQVLSLGAGYDTSFFQLCKDGLVHSGITWVELDFLEVTRRKASIVDASPVLQEMIAPTRQVSQLPWSTPNVDTQHGCISSPQYHLFPADLRCLADIEIAWQRCGLDYAVPTFLLAECVLVYMERPASDGLLHWFAHNIKTSAIAVYEQLNPNDAFGQQMMHNLERRGCPLLGILPSLQAHELRLQAAGWLRTEARSMADLHRNCLNSADKIRVERLEPLDEFEEWDLLQGHYCVALGVNDETGVLDKVSLAFNTRSEKPLVESDAAGT
jgi:tRNA wybutosine-synthesizing protein 4